MFNTPGGTIWVCQDCMFMHANGEEPLDRPATEPELWNRFPLAAEISMGLGREEHDCDYATGGEYGECDCEHQSFSWQSCDGCGSTLGGDRHAFTYWTDEDTTTTTTTEGVTS